MERLSRSTLIAVAAIVVTLLAVALIIFSGPATRETYDPPPADTSPLSGTVTQKWTDCFKACDYWFILETSDGVSTRYSPNKALYDQLGLGDKVKLVFANGPADTPVLSGADIVEKAPPAAAPAQPANGEPVPAAVQPSTEPPAQPDAHHKAKRH